MAEAKAKSKSSGNGDEVAAAGAQEVQERVDKEQEQGFWGEEVDPIPNEEYSLESGPDSPSVKDIDEAVNTREGKSRWEVK